jgi:PST family polysaccharide transporter
VAEWAYSSGSSSRPLDVEIATARGDREMDAPKETSAAQSDLTQTASKSVFWTLSGNVGVSAIRFVGTMILARILLPQEFGIVAMSLVYYGVIQLFGKWGMSQALIQRLDVDDDYLSTGFWTSVMVGGSLTVVGIAFSPLAAYFFREPDVQSAIMVLSLNFILSALGSTHAVILMRELKFRTLTVIDLSSTVIRVVFIIIAALNGLGYWSIILGLVFNRLIKTAFLVLKVRWIPVMRFQREKFHHLFKFGRNYYGYSVLQYLNDNMDYMVTGRLLGAANLAYYQFAFALPHLALSHIAEGVNTASYPILSKVQEDKERVARGFLKTARFVSLLTFPMMMGLIFVARDFILTAYGDRWLPSVLPMQILCFSGALRSVIYINESLLKSQGRPDLGLKWGLFFLPLSVIAVIVGSRWGIAGVAYAMLALAGVSIAYVYLGLRLVRCSLVEYLLNLLPALVCSGAMVAALGIVSRIPVLTEIDPWWRLLANAAIGACVYVAAVRIVYRGTFTEFLEFVGNVFQRRST